MNGEPYGAYLRAQGISDPERNARLSVVASFTGWLAACRMQPETLCKDDFHRYIDMLAEKGCNTMENLEFLCEYLLWAGLRKQYIALVEITDCYNGMQKLAEAIEKKHGAELRRKIFAEPFPPLGADEAARCAYTQLVTGRMKALLSVEDAREAWYQVQHGIPETSWQAHDAQEKETYAPVTSIDEFLRKKQMDRCAKLHKMREQDTLWFTMELTDEVLAFVTGEAHMQWGSHNGKQGIVITKVPYRPAQYLHAENDTMKRYYACHCPLVREAILRGESVSGDVCYCSLGHASHFLAGLNVPLKGEVLQSAVMGDDRCRFIFYLPDDFAGPRPYG